MIKDIKTVTVSLKKSKCNLDIMFRILAEILSLHADVASVRNTNQVTGKLKKGLPGFNELGMPAEVTISTIMNRFMEIICMKEV